MSKKVKHPSLKALHKKAWKLQSEWIRRCANGICFTCGDKREWKSQQAGHYIHKDCLDFTLLNIKCQCVHCNKWLSGNSGVYAERLISEYGEQAIAELRLLSNQYKKFTVEELQNLVEDYKQKLKALQEIKDN